MPRVEKASQLEERVPKEGNRVRDTPTPTVRSPTEMPDYVNVFASNIITSQICLGLCQVTKK